MRVNKHVVIVGAVLFFGLLATGVQGFSVSVQHDVGLGKFKDAGAFTLTTKNQQKGRAARIVFARSGLSEDDRRAFEALVEQDGYYRLRIPGASQGLSAAYDISASVRARCLVASGFQEQIVLHVDPSERIFSLDYATAFAGCRPGLEVSLPGRWSLPAEADVAVRKPAAAPVIDAPRPRLADSGAAGFADEYDGEERDEERLGDDGKPRRKKEEPKTFLEKNWMLMVFGGMLVMNVLGGLGQTLEGSQAGGGAQQRRAR